MRHLATVLALLVPIAAAAQDGPTDGACACEDSDLAINVRIFEGDDGDLVDELQRIVPLGCEALSDRRARALRARYTASCVEALGPDDAGFCAAVGHDAATVLRTIALRADPVHVALTAMGEDTLVVVEREDGRSIELDPDLAEDSFFSEILDNPSLPLSRRALDLDCRLAQRSFVAQGAREDLVVLESTTAETVVVRCRAPSSPYEAVIAVDEGFVLDCADAAALP